MAERIDLIAPDVEKLNGQRGLNGDTFTIHSNIYPARSGLSLHHDHQPHAKGALAYFILPQLDTH